MRFLRPTSLQESTPTRSLHGRLLCNLSQTRPHKVENLGQDLYADWICHPKQCVQQRERAPCFFMDHLVNWPEPDKKLPVVVKRLCVVHPVLPRVGKQARSMASRVEPGYPMFERCVIEVMVGGRDRSEKGHPRYDEKNEWRAAYCKHTQGGACTSGDQIIYIGYVVTLKNPRRVLVMLLEVPGEFSYSAKATINDLDSVKVCM